MVVGKIVSIVEAVGAVGRGACMQRVVTVMMGDGVDNCRWDLDVRRVVVGEESLDQGSDRFGQYRFVLLLVVSLVDEDEAEANQRNRDERLVDWGREDIVQGAAAAPMNRGGEI